MKVKGGRGEGGSENKWHKKEMRSAMQLTFSSLAHETGKMEREAP